jgi:thiamine biosynthesis lipoprotein
MRKIIYFLVLSILILSLAGCGERQSPYASRNAFLLDTVVTIKIYDRNVPEKVWEDAFGEIERLDALLSVHTEGSDTARLNEAAGLSPVTVSPETLKVIQRSIYFSRMTGGLFDITAGPLVDLWAINPPEGHVPTAAELAETLPLIGWEDIEIDEEQSQAYLTRSDMAVDLGAIAKGYIADRVKEVLTADGIEHAIISLGGNIQFVGDTAYGIGIQDPDKGSGEYLGRISLADASAASSGDYERYFEKDGVRYHHILDPQTGYPADTGLRGVSVAAPQSVDADALSTAVFLLGPKAGMVLIEELPDVEAVLITDDKTVLLSSGLTEHFELVRDSGYRVSE